MGTDEDNVTDANHSVRYVRTWSAHAKRWYTRKSQIIYYSIIRYVSDVLPHDEF